MIFRCAYCIVTAFQKELIQEHIKKFHKDVLKSREAAKQFICEFCNQKFNSKHAVSRHRNQLHKAEIQSTIQSLKSRKEAAKQYICEFCNKKFKSKYTVSNHRIHQHKSLKIKNTIQCLEQDCFEKLPSLFKFREHLKTKHGMLNFSNCEEKIFTNEEDFKLWLSEEEEKIQCNFTRMGGKVKTLQYTKTNLYCSRSGKFHSKSKGIRQPRVKGSKKVGHHCTAQIIIKEYTDNIKIEYYSMHYKHDFPPSHFQMPKEMKNKVAGKSIQDIAENRILSNFRVFENDDPLQSITLDTSDTDTDESEAHCTMLNKPNTADSISTCNNVTSNNIIKNKLLTLAEKIPSECKIDPFIALQIMRSCNKIENLLDINLKQNVTSNGTPGTVPGNKKYHFTEKILFYKKIKVKNAQN